MNAHFENESTFWKWKHILKMKSHFEMEVLFSYLVLKRPNALLLSPYERHASTLKSKHILKMKVHFENESTFWKWKFFFHTLSWRDLMPFTWVHKNYIHSHSSQKWKHISKMKAHSKNENTFQKWEHILQNKSTFFHTLSWRDLMPSSWVHMKDMHPHSGTMKWCLNCLHVHISTWHFLP